MSTFSGKGIVIFPVVLLDIIKTKQNNSGAAGEQSVSGKGWAQGSQLRMELLPSISFSVVIQSPAIPKQTGEDSLSLLEQQK